MEIGNGTAMLQVPISTTPSVPNVLEISNEQPIASQRSIRYQGYYVVLAHSLHNIQSL